MQNCFFVSTFNRLGCFFLFFLAFSQVGWSLDSSPQKGFDVQNFRPTPGPRDLIIVPQSQAMAKNSFSAGAFFSFSFDPLVLLGPDKRVIQDGNLVKLRTELDVVGAWGVHKYLELGISVPIIFYQSSDNLHQIGREETIRPVFPGDISLLAKVPLLHRWYKGKAQDEEAEKKAQEEENQLAKKEKREPRQIRMVKDKGLGFALGMRLNLPTGSPADFTGDGTSTISINPNAIIDYRWERGYVLSGQVGFFNRPYVQLTEQLKLGPTFTFALGTEIPIVRSRGITGIGGVYGNIALDPKVWKDPNACVAAEGLLGLRWYSNSGVVWTSGLNFGGNCGIGTPTFRFWTGVVWTPATTNQKLKRFAQESANILAWKKGEQETPKPKCPSSQDEFNELRRNKLSLPPNCADILETNDSIDVLGVVSFATDQDVILPESFDLLERVVKVMQAALLKEPKLFFQVDGHTDSRAEGDAEQRARYNMGLSKRRAFSVKEFLVEKGIPDDRLITKGFGLTKPLVQDTDQDGNLNETNAALNRRVEFKKMVVPTDEQADKLRKQQSEESKEVQRLREEQRRKNRPDEITPDGKQKPARKNR